MIILSIWPTTVAGWISFIILLGSLIASLAKLIPTLIKLKKITAEAIIKKNISELKKTATTAMKIAQSTEKSGAEKKEYVIKNVETISEASNVELTEEDWIEISEFIDNMKDFYNQMRKNDKNKGV